MRESRVEILAGAMWMTALSFMVFGTLDSARVHHNSEYLAWGLFLGMVALVPSMMVVAKWAMNRSEDTSVEHIVEVVDTLHQGHANVSRLR